MDQHTPQDPDGVARPPAAETRIAAAFGGVERRADPARADRINTVRAPARRIIHMPVKPSPAQAANAPGVVVGIQAQPVPVVDVDELTTKSVGQVASARSAWHRLTESGAI